jgi:hypothetical protein
MWIGYVFLEIIPGVTADASDHDLLTFDDFRVVSTLLWDETPDRLGEAGQLKGDDSIRAFGSSIYP